MEHLLKRLNGVDAPDDRCGGAVHNRTKLISSGDVGGNSHA